MDYYVLHDADGGGGVVVVEEFVFGDDFAAVGLDCAGWIAGDRRWWSSAEFSRGMRGDPGLRERVVPVQRREAEEAYARLGGGELPGEAVLRGYFRDRQALRAAPPLRFGADDRWIYRLLCAKELDEAGVSGLRTLWRMTPVHDPAARLIGRARAEVGGRWFAWELRRIGPGVAWCVDISAAPSPRPGFGGPDSAVGGPDSALGGLAGAPGGPGPAFGGLLSGLKRDVRRHGLIPVTIERLA